MIDGLDAGRILACAPRPESSWAYLAALIAFAAATRWLAPRTLRSRPR